MVGTELIAIPLFAAGHLWRDSLPNMGSTFAARYCGLVLCVMGAAFAIGGHRPSGWVLAAGVLVGVGYWLDRRHGEGQGARTWKDARDLLISASTSLGPFMLFAFTLVLFPHHDWPALVAVPLAVVAKPAIWFAAWRASFVKDRYPTRWAAAVYGGAVAVAVMCL